MIINIDDLLVKSILVSKNLNIIKFLIENGGNINIKINNENLLNIVCKDNIKNVSLIEYIIDNIDISLINEYDNNNKKPIDYILETEIKYIDFKHLIYCLNRKVQIQDKDTLNKIQNKLNSISINEYTECFSVIGC
jgi:hypothetical protein